MGVCGGSSVDVGGALWGAGAWVSANGKLRLLKVGWVGAAARETGWWEIAPMS